MIGPCGEALIPEPPKPWKCRITFHLSREDMQAILENVCMDEEEAEWRRRGICREYIENKVAELVRELTYAAKVGAWRKGF